MEAFGGLLILLVILMMIIVPVVLFILLVVFILKKNRQRQDEMLVAASQLKAVYTTRPPTSVLDQLRQFRFNKHGGYGGRIEHLFDLKRDDVPWKVFDYSYETRMGGASSDSLNDKDLTHTYNEESDRGM